IDLELDRLIRYYSISGRIATGDNNPDVSAGTVTLLENDIPVLTVSPAANGDYILPQVAEGTYSIRGELAGYESRTTTAFEVTAQITGKNLLLHRPGYTVSGRLLTEDNNPDVSAAKITIKQNGLSIAGFGPVSPGADGAYSIPDVPVGTAYTITAVLGGYGTETTTAFEVAGPVTGKDLTLPRNRSVSGRISTSTADGSEPVSDLSGAAVVLKRDGVVVEGAQLTVAPNGAFTLSNVPIGTGYTITAGLNYFTSQEGLPFAVTGDTTGQDFELVRAQYPVTGKLITSEASETHLLQNATLTLERNGQVVPGLAPIGVDAAGLYTIPGLWAYPGYRLRVSLPGYNPNESAVFELGAPLTLPDITLVLRHYYVKADGDDASDGSEAHPFKTLVRGVEMAHGSIANRDVVVLGTLNGDNSGNSGSANAKFNIEHFNNRVITIRGKEPPADVNDLNTFDARLTRGSGSMGLTNNLFINASKLILKDIVIVMSDKYGILVDGASELTLENCLIYGCYSTGLAIESGAVRMNGGVIRNNFLKYGGTGGGVTIAAGSSFYMKDGAIKDHWAGQAGGVYNLGTFTMEGGEITNNCGGYTYGGGVMSSGTFTMIGGLIANNYVERAQGGGGVYIHDGDLTIINGRIENNRSRDDDGSAIPYGYPSNGGGLYIRGTGSIELQCSITGNTAASDGGGIYLDFSAGAPSKFVLKSGTRIAGNTADRGGGIFYQNPYSALDLLIEDDVIIYGGSEGALSNTADGKGDAVWENGSERNDTITTP
ncbi:MAG: hypothetical protein LBQ38_01745, partial [Spirochaetaceae bacterium]|nr:hypothetical protein [Spirochaetaceae bacterium]